MGPRDEVPAWTNEALRTLEIAQQISTLAHTSLKTTTEALCEEFPIEIKNALADFETLLKQHMLLASITKNIQASVLQVTDGHDKKVLAILQPALRELDAVLAALHETDVPSFLLKNKTDEKAYKLDDFVALDDIGTLRANIEIYRGNCGKISTLLRTKLDSVMLAANSKLSDFKSIKATHEEHIITLKPFMKYANGDFPAGKTTDLVGTILRENNALGLELTSLLEMLTNHYDQCVLAASRAEAETVDLEVLRGDTLELPSVLSEVRAIHDIIKNNQRRAAAFVEPKLIIILDFAGKCRAFSEWYTGFEANDVMELMLMLMRSQKVYMQSSLEDNVVALSPGPVEAYASLVNDLATHYRHFRSVYQAQYLSELHFEQYVYPRKFLKTLDDFLNGELYEIENDEHERRSEWLRKYGEYIPGDFYLPGESDQPRVVQVISEGLDHLEHDSAPLDEARLVQMLKDKA
ncbi:autophagy-related protein 17 [Metschnikowia aff. pulcherrima]|uniref:Autophagy-related protein 17 n=1 Tax=Metschnikowia aff. pulcherrima TaxID=2163413 RepID=A0A4P6XKM5_9ASCO|nr:autophagy-related protein 17 [Metschnikowia aff. pulcherrima]